MKKCVKCLEEKSDIDFHKGGKTGKLHSYCKICNISQRMEKYRADPSATRKHQEKSKQDRQHRLWELLAKSPCIDCGFADPRALEFDHLRDKEYDISVMVRNGMAWRRIEEEILKCDIVCSNCHQIRTCERSKSWRSKKSPLHQ